MAFWGPALTVLEGGCRLLVWDVGVLVWGWGFEGDIMGHCNLPMLQ